MRLININKKNKEKGTEIGAEWYFNSGGYAVCYWEKFKRISFPTAMTFCHRFAVSGNHLEGKEREFIFRFQYDYALDAKSSILDIQIVNPYEARWFSLWLKVTPIRCLKIIFNFGWRLSKRSRDVMRTKIAEELVRERKTKIEVPNYLKNGEIKQWHNQKQIFEAK